VQEYACFNWCYHLHQILVNGGDHAFEPLSEGSLLRRLKDFVSQSLDFWVNTILSDGYKKHMDVLDSVLSALVQSQHFSQHLVQVLNDIRKNAKEDFVGDPEDCEEWLTNLLEGLEEFGTLRRGERWQWLEGETAGELLRETIETWRTQQSQQRSHRSLLPINSDDSPTAASYQVSR